MWLPGGHTVARLCSDLNPGVAMMGVRALTSALTATGYVYKSAANHDPDGSSNGTRSSSDGRDKRAHDRAMA